MDPHANITEQRELAQMIVTRGNTIRTVDSVEGVTFDLMDLADRLAELVQALDEWRSNGGFDPYAV